MVSAEQFKVVLSDSRVQDVMVTVLKELDDTGSFGVSAEPDVVDESSMLEESVDPVLDDLEEAAPVVEPKKPVSVKKPTRKPARKPVKKPTKKTEPVVVPVEFWLRCDNCQSVFTRPLIVEKSFFGAGGAVCPSCKKSSFRPARAEDVAVLYGRRDKKLMQDLVAGGYKRYDKPFAVFIKFERPASSNVRKGVL